MNSIKTEQNEFCVIGLQVRTSNAKEMAGEGKIQALWNQLFSEQVLSKISGRLDENIYGIYHAYESDMSGEYLLTVGAKVEPGTRPPEGLEVVKIPTQNYMKFTTPVGEMPGVVVAGWQHIWKSELKRNYLADFEVYDHRCADPKSAQIDIFIGVE